MAGPWEAYQQKPPAGPWEAYQDQPATTGPLSGDALTELGSRYGLKRGGAERDDAFRARLRSKLRGVTQAREARADAGGTTELMTAVNQGLSLGLSDEIIGGVEAMLGGDYGESVARQREALRLGREDLPVTSLAAEVTGGAPAAIATGGSSAVIRGGGSLAGNVGRSAGVAGAYGAGYGFGAGENDVGERLQSATESGVLSVGLGVATPLVVAGVGRGYSVIADRLRSVFGGNKAQANIAARKVVQAIMRDNPGMTAEQALGQAQRNLQEIGPEAFLADTGENARSLTGAMARNPGEGKSIITKAVTERQKGVDTRRGAIQGGQQARIDKMLDRATPRIGSNSAAMGVGPIDDLPPKLRETTERLFKERSAAGRATYEKALAVKPVYSERLTDFVNDPITKRGFARGLELQRLEALAEGRKFNPNDYAVVDFNAAGDPVIGPVPNMKTYDAIHDGLAAIVKDETNDLTGRLTKRGVAVQRVHKKFLSEIDRINPAYAEARQAWAGPSKLLDATNSGFKFMSKSEFTNPEALAYQFGRMSKIEKDHFRVGAIQAIRDRVGETVRGGDATRVFLEKPGMRKKLQTVFGPRWPRLLRGLKGEKTMNETFAEITGNSRTAGRLAEDADAAIDPAPMLQATADVTRGQYVSALRSLLRGTYQGVKGRLTAPEPVRAEIARYLTSRETGGLTQGVEAAELSEEARLWIARALLTAEQASTGSRTER